MSMRFTWLAAAVVLAASLQVSAGPPWTPAAFPNPKVDIDKCGRDGKPSNICDPDSVISTQAANRVEGILKEIYEGSDPYVRAPCGSEGLEGYQVAVALMRSMEVPEGEAPAAQAAVFAKNLHDSWGVGDAVCNNGALMLLALRERQVYISTGSGAASALTETHIAYIIDAMRPLLRQEKYDDAVEQAVVDIGLALAGKEAEGGGVVDWFAVAFFGVVAMLLGNSCRRSWLRRREYRDCTRMLAKLKKEQEQVRNHAWSAPVSCPICLEDFNPPPAGHKNEASSGDVKGLAGEAGPSNGPSSVHAAAPADDSPSTSLLVGEETGRDGVQTALEELPCRRGMCRSGSGGGVRRRSVGKGLDEEGDRGGGSGQQLRVPITLACGHTFCDPCLTRWLQQKTTCPICREKVTDNSPSPPDNLQSAAGAGEGQANRVLPDFWAMELAFRLGSLQRMYPGYVSPTMADQWAAEARETGTFNWEASRDFQLRDPGMRAQHENSGSAGFSTSFGGGSSYGGGGGGGSW